MDPSGRAADAKMDAKATQACPERFVGSSLTSSVTPEESVTYLYDIENRLVSAAGGKSATLRYDPLGRLYEIEAGALTTRLLYDGDALVAEYDGSGTLLKRYVHGPGRRARRSANVVRRLGAERRSTHDEHDMPTRPTRPDSFVQRRWVDITDLMNMLRLA